MTRLFQAVEQAGGQADWHTDELMDADHGLQVWECYLLDRGTLTAQTLSEAAFRLLSEECRGTELKRNDRGVWVVTIYLTEDYKD